MKVWILFKITWDSYGHKYNESIFGIYNSKAKADGLKVELEKEEQDNYNSLSRFEKEEWEEYGYKMDKYFVKEYLVQ